MKATKKNTRLASDAVQTNHGEASPQALLARIMDLETLAAEPLAKLHKAQADAEAAKAAEAAKVNPPATPAPANVVTIESLQAQLNALIAAQKTSA